MQDSIDWPDLRRAPFNSHRDGTDVGSSPHPKLRVLEYGRTELRDAAPLDMRRGSPWRTESLGSRCRNVGPSTGAGLPRRLVQIGGGGGFMSVAMYPVQVDATLDSRISRWMWIVRWRLLVIPHDMVLLMNRWVLRVAAYAGLMTDTYPPFKLDMGGSEPAGTVTVLRPPTGPIGPTVALAETPPSPEPTPGSEPTEPASPPTAPASPPTAPAATPTAPPPAPPSGRRGWTAGRVVSLVIGSVLGLIALGVLAGAGAATWATNSQRDSAGFLTSDTHRIATPAYAITSGGIDLGTGTDWVTPADIFGKVRIRATAINPTAGVFIGVGSKTAVDSYLAGVGHEVVTNWANGDTRYEPGRPGGPQTAPGDAAIWTAQASGQGTQTLSWRPESGQWEVVVMNPDGAAGVSVIADVGATVPDLAWIAVILFAIGAVLLLAAVALVVVPVIRASR